MSKRKEIMTLLVKLLALPVLLIGGIVMQIVARMISIFQPKGFKYSDFLNDESNQEAF